VIFIGGNVTGSNIIIGNGMIINNNPDSITSDENPETQPNPDKLQSQMPSKGQKTPKKWWQFWKI
jgi:hypothetical protein